MKYKLLILTLCLLAIVGLESCDKTNKLVSHISKVQTEDGDKVSVSYLEGCKIDDYFHSDKEGLQGLIEAISFGFLDTISPKYFTTDSVTIQKITLIGTNEIGVQRYLVNAKCSGLAIYATGEKEYLTGYVKIFVLYNGKGHAEYDMSEMVDKDIYELYWKELMEKDKAD